MLVCDVCGKELSADERLRNLHFYTVVYDPRTPEFPYNNTVSVKAEYADICSKECADKFLGQKGQVQGV